MRVIVTGGTGFIGNYVINTLLQKNIKVTDYIMEKQGLLLDINAFLTSPLTHKRIIMQLCPELRFEEKYLE